MEQAINVDQAIKVILAVAAGIVAIGGAGVVLSRCATPIIGWRKRLEAVERNQSRDLERLNASDEYDKMVIKALIALLEHGETGNATKTMYNLRKELEEYLISR